MIQGMPSHSKSRDLESLPCLWFLIFHTPDLNPGTADIVIDLNHPVEGAMLGLMKIAVAARLLDHCLHMTIHLNLHKQNAIVVEDAAPLLRVRVLQNDQDRPT